MNLINKSLSVTLIFYENRNAPFNTPHVHRVIEVSRVK